MESRQMFERGVLDYVVTNPVITVQLTITIMSSFSLGTSVSGLWYIAFITRCLGLVTAMAAATVFILL